MSEINWDEQVQVYIFEPVGIKNYRVVEESVIKWDGIDFAEAVKLNPRDYASYSSRSLAYLEKREFDKALADLNLLLSAGPKNITNYQRRA